MKRLLVRLALVVAPPLLLLGAAEGFVRLRWGDELDYSLAQPEAGRAYFGAGMLSAIEEDGVRFAGTPGAEVTIGETTYRHDALGLRLGPDEVDKPDGTFRVLVLGDSNAYGWRVAAEETFAHRIGAALDEATPDDVAVDVALLAYPGYNTGDQRALLARLGPRLDPDLVLLAWYVNDMERLGFHVGHDGSFFADPLPVPDEWRATLWRSALYKKLSIGRVEVMRKTNYKLGEGENKQFAERELLASRDWCGEHGTRFAVVDVPVLEPPHRQFRLARDGNRGAVGSAWLQQICAREQIPCLELFPTVDGEAAAALWASVEQKDHHPNAEAHRRFAAAIVPFLREHGLSP